MAADPDAVIRSFSGPLLIDEWQVLPDVLGAVKRAVTLWSGTAGTA